MARYLILAFCSVLFLLPGCAGHKYEKDNVDMKANLEPEVWDNSLILKDLKRGRPLTEQEKQALASRGSIQFNLDVKDNEEVQMFLQYFSMDKRGTMERWLARAEPHLPYVRAVLASYDLPPDLIVLPFIESGYSNMAYSPVGAGGMWQFMPYTGRRFGLTVDWWVDERRDPYKATVAAAKYLTKLYQMFGDWNLALAAYNAGEGKISRVMAASGQCDFFDIAKDPNLLKEETKHYVPKFLAVLKIFQNLDTLGFKKINWKAGPDLKEVSVPGGTDLLALAQACGMTWEQFREANAAFRRQVSPPDQSVNVYVPVSKEQTALAFLKNPDNYPAAGYQNYQAQAGDTWWNVSRRTGIPIAELRQFNASLPETLSAGQSVRVPSSASSDEATALAEGPDACKPKPLVAAAKPQRYRVNKGDSIGSIARKYGLSTQELLAANKMKRAGRLTLGTWIVIPGGQQSQAVAENAKPAPAPVAAADSSAAHTVQRGETASGIAAKYGISTEELMAANNLRSARELMAGKSLVIPGKPGKAPAGKPSPEPALFAAAATDSGTYVVKSGDTLASISQRFSIDTKQLQAANRLASGKVRAGDKLTIPQPFKPQAPAPKALASKETTPAPKALATKETAPERKPAAAPAPEPKVLASKEAAFAPKPLASRDPAPKALAAAPGKAASATKAPAKAVNYKVNPGETVWAIARKFNVEPSSLMAWNNMKSPNSLQAGAEITIRKD